MIVFERGPRLPAASKSFAVVTMSAAFAACLAACGGGSAGDTAAPPAVTAGAREDPLFPFQWHLVNTGQSGHPTAALHGLRGVDLNVAPVWRRGFDGTGVTVAVLDNGVEIGHQDLRANIAPGLSFNYRTGAVDPTPAEQGSSHGTSVAGVIAAARNGIGGVGVAPGAKLAGLNVLTTQYLSDVVDALGRGIRDNTIAISNNSWGPASGGMPAPPYPMLAEILRRGVDQGRAGKGIVYIFSGGNHHHDEIEFFLSGKRTPDYTPSNFYGHRTKQALIVCAVNARGVASAYSANGSNLLVCAPSNDTSNIEGSAPTPGITTTETFGRYGHDFGGTSAAAPAVSGVVALMLQANPNLTWRDVRLILARTARILPSMAQDPAAEWIKTGAHNPHTGRKYQYSTRYGFGLVDADAAVSYAQRFISVGGSSAGFWATTCSGSGNASEDKAAAGAVEQSIFMGCGNRTVEFLEADLTLEHPNFRALRVTLESPSGTEIVLSPEYANCAASFDLRGETADACGTASISHRYSTHAVTALDEPATGVWTLRIEDALGTGVPVRLRNAALHIT
ncbi:hypothetical protein C0Z18_10525 [Trinickia dabaoshanensis]|uniref:P/Homo B domain-containing protein n=1 Tax=Trinickia dabaoshanensis TaxID=564714 RepID=A0A2N7VTA7_9BURK|nr:S8 family serine peptidase [Trinickia dabaoshanensis]PMS20369.1 hypothetical protein C0Z18_10525 [Trinickia dabaoshanensis]